MESARVSSSTPPEESTALESILEPSMTCKEFFNSTWQRSCAIFPAADRSQDDKQRQPSMKNNPYVSLIQNGWSTMLDMMDESMEREAQIGDKEKEESASECALFFQQQSPLSLDERASLYNNSGYAAYLDGCSLVHNHADLLSPALASLCEDLQKSFPHAYCNTYLTAPDSQAVSEHADDRDVLVIQVHGSKEWTVFQRIPIPYPYPEEQVGKGGLSVPPEVLQGPVLINKTLQPGDVLYMPRGYVHRARCSSGAPSFHVTVALATHDWTLAGQLAQHTERLLRNVGDYRMALPRVHCSQNWDDVSSEGKEHLQQLVDEAFNTLKKQTTAQIIHESLQNKVQTHNERAFGKRQHVLQRDAKKCALIQNDAVVGPNATRKVTLDSFIRISSDEEKKSVTAALLPGANRPGLQVRECIADDVMILLQKMRSNAKKKYRVGDLRKTLAEAEVITDSRLCDLSLLSFVKQCVALGAFALEQNNI